MPNNESLSKEDLFLLLESYKNSVEMNTVISQQLTHISDIIKNCKDDSSLRESNIISKIENIVGLVDKLKEKLEGHNTESIKGRASNLTGIGKITNKVNLLYVAFGSIVISLILLIATIVLRYDQIKAIATHLGV